MVDGAEHRCHIRGVKAKNVARARERKTFRELPAKEDPAETDSRELAELLLPAVRGPHRELTEKHFDQLRQRARRKFASR